MILNENNKEEVSRRLENFYNSVNPELYIKYYPVRTVNWRNIDAYITSLILEKKIKKPIGLIIIDYDDLLLPEEKTQRDYEDAGNVYFDLIKLGNKYNCPVLTLSQPRRESWTKVKNGELFDSSDISRSSMKVMNCTGIFSLNKTGKNSYILYPAVLRRGEGDVKIHLYSDLSRARFYEELDTCPSGLANTKDNFEDDFN